MCISQQPYEIASDIHLSDLLAVSDHKPSRNQTMGKQWYSIFHLQSRSMFFCGHFIMECCLYPCRNSKLGRWRTTPCHKTRNATCTPAFFPVCARVFRILQRFFFGASHRANPVLQKFRFVLRAGVHPSTSVLQAPRWGCRWLPIMWKTMGPWSNPPQSIKRKISHRCLDHAKLTILITINRDQNRKFRPSGVRVGQNKIPGPQFQNHNWIKCTALPYFAYI